MSKNSINSDNLHISLNPSIRNQPHFTTKQERGQIIGNTLKYLRHGAGLTQSEVSSLIGIAQQTYDGYESGKHEPSIEILISFANLYNTTMDFISSRNWSCNKEDLYPEVHDILKATEDYCRTLRENEKEYIRLFNKTIE